MDAQKLGRKIREARLAKRLTQSEVVGDFITRNMLSQIESGTATPSMKTLEYLSEVLSIPMVQLVAGDDPIETLAQAKNALAQGQADSAILLAGNLTHDLHDESDAIAARAHLILARQYALEREYDSATKHARFAAEHAQRGVYASVDIRANALLLLDEIENY
ncbi:MAG: helix-turn-helix transcriptional regulator [Clostridium sp.]|uniref:helix-turn-helix domain-containing protein n=1 Tax=Clostridium sp. TaxID=1506 RepID=UPI002906B141|nr:helix-turn-helix transcriptional regulator [Clostridium sp.]MDU7338388.1 helix-turn-helix transcriptional regulator [Clostridium sp.]